MEKKLPGRFKVCIITLSDRAFRGEYEDLSGPAVKDMTEHFFSSTGAECSTDYFIIPDDAEQLKEKVIEASLVCDIVITTGGTGIGPRDITPDTIRPLLTREILGIMEYIRVKYGKDKPAALLSRSIAGLRGKCLIFTLPGSVKAVIEYMNEITAVLQHTLEMIHGMDHHK